MLDHTSIRRCIGGIAVLVLPVVWSAPPASAQSAACAQMKGYHQTASEAAAGYTNQLAPVEAQLPTPSKKRLAPRSRVSIWM